MTSQSLVRTCDASHNCKPPQDCCKLAHTQVHQNVSNSTTLNSNPLFLGHWYFWLAITATIAGILCACSLWRRHSQGSLCCRDSGRDERASEPDSNGSCYAPPQYSRCSSFHQAPPPYSEVTSKPDLYPLVISYNGDAVVKTSNGSTGYLMVQYFRNFIVRPVGSLSATSTNDSLSSSFICNASNEANTVIPPPYSCMGSLEDVAQPASHSATPPSQLPRSASSLTSAGEYQRAHASPSVHSHLSGVATTSSTPSQASGKPEQPSIRNNPFFDRQSGAETNRCANDAGRSGSSVSKCGNSAGICGNGARCALCGGGGAETRCQQQICDASPLSTLHKVNRKVASSFVKKEHSQDSESQEEEHNFSDLLNLSVCVTSSHIAAGIPPHMYTYSVANSMTSSDISSLANLGTPDSPPRATSPTIEMRELLDKIQQLPQQKSPVPEQQAQKSRSYFHRTKAKTLYMPLNEEPKKKVFGKKTWLSRSAPNTPCDIFTPNFSIGGGKRSSGKVSDGSPLLNEREESEDEGHRDECL